MRYLLLLAEGLTWLTLGFTLYIMVDATRHSRLMVGFLELIGAYLLYLIILKCRQKRRHL